MYSGRRGPNTMGPSLVACMPNTVVKQINCFDFFPKYKARQPKFMPSHAHSDVIVLFHGT